MKGIKKYFSEHLSRKIIFAIDLATSIISAFFVLLTLNMMAKSDSYSGVFALWWLGGTVVLSAISMYIVKSYNVIIRHMTLDDIRKYVLGILLSNLMLGVLLSVTCFFNSNVFLAILLNSLLTVVMMLGIRFLMIYVYRQFRERIVGAKNSRRILVYGTSDKSVAAISRFINSRHYHLMGFLSPNLNDKGLKLSGYPVITFQNEGEFKTIVEEVSLSAVLFVRSDDVKKEECRLVRFCSSLNVKTLITPSVDEFVGGRLIYGGMRQVKIEDLLGRPEISISMDEIKAAVRDKVIMVTGAAGSIGSELCRQLAVLGVRQLLLFDNAETPMHNLHLELKARFPQLDTVPIIGDVCHEDRVDYAIRNWRPQIVFHAAAYKHVPLMEENPCEAVYTNVFGSRTVADKCVQYEVEMMVMISTDKAVNPTNIMGCSKRLAEIYVQSLGLAIDGGEVSGKTKFVTTRFGNVLGSNGSVIPRFRGQIENGGPVTVTHPDITRFFMTIPEACRLVMEAACLGTGNQIFVFDMGESVKIVDLAKRMIELAGLKVGEDIQIEYTGLRPGEKLFEEVLARTECTEPTSHERIRIARVREYSYKEAARIVDELTELSRCVNIPDMVRLMKRVVPEFISQNSRFEEFDK